jgi:uncharacterized protein YndB with AHSA1/START domain
MERIEAIVAYRFPFVAEMVYETWLNPDSVRKWMSSALRAMGLSGDLGIVEVDARLGGRFCFSDKRPSGEAFHWGTYRQLDFPTRIHFTWNAGSHVQDKDDELSLVSIELVPTDIGCDVTLVHSMDPQWEEYLERTENGWRNMLVHIDQMLSG